jgi:hypothetical protein
VRSRARSIVEIIAWGTLLLALVQIPGAALDSVIRKTVAAPATTAVLLLVAALLGLRWSSPVTPPRRRRALAAVAVALTVAAVQAQIAGALLLRHQVQAVPEAGILVPAAGRSTQCRGLPRRCHEIVINELGLRGPTPRRATSDTRLVAFIGDSYVFGAGVGEDDTVPALLTRRLADLRPPVVVANAGIEGINGGSFPGVIAHVRKRLRPDLIAVLVKDDDLDPTDKFARWERFRRSFWFRMLYVTNLEPTWETARQLFRNYFGRRGLHADLRRQLDAIAAASSGTPLLVVAAVGYDLRETFAAWTAAHPAVGHTASWEHPGFSEAEKIPHDGHWSETGCATIAAFVAPALRRELAAPTPVAAR